MTAFDFGDRINSKPLSTFFWSLFLNRLSKSPNSSVFFFFFLTASISCASNVKAGYGGKVHRPVLPSKENDQRLFFGPLGQVAWHGLYSYCYNLLTPSPWCPRAGCTLSSCMLEMVPFLCSQNCSWALSRTVPGDLSYTCADHLSWMMVCCWGLCLGPFWFAS